jgi:hypothetical protein
MTTQNDWRALCAELVNDLHDYKVANEQYEDALVNRARARLAQPEPQGPTDEELRALWRLGWQSKDPEDGAVLFAKEALASWGRPTIKPEPQGPTLADEAYVAFVQICKGNSDDAGTYEADEELVRRALKRLSDLERRPAIKPVPVAERLPGPEDCFPDDRGQRSYKCWAQQYHTDNDGQPLSTVLEAWDLVDYRLLKRCRRWYYA